MMKHHINGCIRIYKTRADFPLLMAGHARGRLREDLLEHVHTVSVQVTAQPVSRKSRVVCKRRVCVEHERYSSRDEWRSHRSAFNLCVERKVCRRNLRVARAAVCNQIRGRARRDYVRGEICFARKLAAMSRRCDCWRSVVIKKCGGG